MNEELVDIVMKIHQFNQDLTSLNIKYSEEIEELKQKIDKTIIYVDLLEKAFIERDVKIDYLLLDIARQLLEENIEIPEITIKYLRGDKDVS